MKVTVFRIAIYENPTIKAKASITVDDAIAINNIVLKEIGPEKYSISFPKKDRQGERYSIVHPVSLAARKYILSVILAAYHKELQGKIHTMTMEENT